MQSQKPQQKSADKVQQVSPAARPSGMGRNGARVGRAPSRSAAISAETTTLPLFVPSIAENTPAPLFGEDRIMYQAEQLARIDVRDRTLLRAFFDQYLQKMITLNASDVDMGGPSANGQVWFRVDGEKKPDPKFSSLSLDESNLVILGLLNKSKLDSLKEWKAADFSYELPLTTGTKRKRFRATIYLDMGMLAVNMRAISDELRPLKSLAFHPMVEKGMMFRHVRDGLTLITGVTGSGKSTTLDSIIDANNEDVHGHAVIIGNPIEFVHESKKCIIRHREVGSDVHTFKDGIVQALRQDPDIVVIGEMRDPATISSALEITDSGHKVFSTLHTSSALESIERIIAEYPPEEQARVRFRLADVLRCIVSQKLCPKVGGGRVLAKEVMWMTPSARAAIKNGNINEIYQMMWEGWNIGQITLEQDLYRLMRQGMIAPETAINYCNNKRRFQQLAK